MISSCLPYHHKLKEANESYFLQRICFQIEEAHWYYEDFLRVINPGLPTYNLRSFIHQIFEHIPPSLTPNLPLQEGTAEKAFADFMTYKSRVPVRGAIMLNLEMDKCLLVKGWKSSATWAFPRGKIDQNENDVTCAVREVREETGFDLEDSINKDHFLETTMKDQNIRLYIIPGISEETHFAPRTRKEISKIEWHKLSDMPGFQPGKSQKVQQLRSGRFYMVAPFMKGLKKWILTSGRKWLEQQQKADNNTHEEQQHLKSAIAHVKAVEYETDQEGPQSPPRNGDSEGLKQMLGIDGARDVVQHGEFTPQQQEDASQRLREILFGKPIASAEPQVPVQHGPVNGSGAGSLNVNGMSTNPNASELLSILNNGRPQQSPVSSNYPQQQQLNNVLPPPPFVSQIEGFQNYRPEPAFQPTSQPPPPFPIHSMPPPPQSFPAGPIPPQFNNLQEMLGFQQQQQQQAQGQQPSLSLFQNGGMPQHNPAGWAQGPMTPTSSAPPPQLHQIHHHPPPPRYNGNQGFMPPQQFPIPNFAQQPPGFQQGPPPMHPHTSGPPSRPVSLPPQGPPIMGGPQLPQQHATGQHIPQPQAPATPSKAAQQLPFTPPQASKPSTAQAGALLSILKGTPAPQSALSTAPGPPQNLPPATRPSHSQPTPAPAPAPVPHPIQILKRPQPLSQPQQPTQAQQPQSPPRIPLRPSLHGPTSPRRSISHSHQPRILSHARHHNSPQKENFRPSTALPPSSKPYPPPSTAAPTIRPGTVQPTAVTSMIPTTVLEHYVQSPQQRTVSGGAPITDGASAAGGTPLPAVKFDRREGTSGDKKERLLAMFKTEHSSAPERPGLVATQKNSTQQVMEKVGRVNVMDFLQSGSSTPVNGSANEGKEQEGVAGAGEKRPSGVQRQNSELQPNQRAGLLAFLEDVASTGGGVSLK